MKKILACLALFSLVGCTEFADTASKWVGMGVVKEEKNLFDGATVIEVTPTFLFTSPDKFAANEIRLGARWISSSPESIGLVFSYESSTMNIGRPAYVGVMGADLNIDGKISSFKATQQTSTNNSGYNSSTRSINTESRNTVTIPYSTFLKMIESKQVLIRVYTSKGFEDSDFTIERSAGGQGTPALSFKEFFKKVEPAKNRLIKK